MGESNVIFLPRLQGFESTFFVADSSICSVCHQRCHQTSREATHLLANDRLVRYRSYIKEHHSAILAFERRPMLCVKLGLRPPR
ncbi:hypothetical protein ACN38_g1222 [Penicillium nordicum]|uniref:Uncharacterized protein n=1 Tax=Penicillium nordicum TaxID=229535 RepID=A0A0M8P8Z4_9EURO|nr:hypothetical protein ACN38_g1222 [Penicillium nordicum]